MKKRAPRGPLSSLLLARIKPRWATSPCRTRCSSAACSCRTSHSRWLCCRPWAPASRWSGPLLPPAPM